MSESAAPDDSKYGQRIQYIEDRMDRTDATIASLTKVVEDSVKTSNRNQNELKDLIQQQASQSQIDKARSDAAKGTITFEGMGKWVMTVIAIGGVGWAIVSTVIGNDIKTALTRIEDQKVSFERLAARVTANEQNFLSKPDIDTRIRDSFERLRERAMLNERQLDDLKTTTVTAKEVEAKAQMRDALAQGLVDRIRRLEDDLKEVRNAVVPRGENAEHWSSTTAAIANLQRQIDAAQKAITDMYGASDKLKELSATVVRLQSEIAATELRAQKGR